LRSFSRTVLLRGIASLVVLLCVSGSSRAQTGANVALVINEESPDSIRIGEYYARKREVPESNVIRIRTLVADGLTRAAYAGSIERPIARALTERGLQDRILYIVLTKGVPLRINGRAGLRGDVASVDSELTLLYRRMTGRDVLVTGPLENPYYLGGTPLNQAKPFNHRDHDIYLVTRLDGFTVDDVLALIDRGSAPSREGRILLDRRTGPAAGPADLWLVDAAAKLREVGHGERVELVETLPTEGIDAVLGYFSWGSNDPANRRRRLGLEFTAGSIGATLTGTDARTFATPPDGWEPGADLRDRTKVFANAPQSLMADLIRDGLTGAGGNISEPLLAGSIRPQVLFPAYLSGFNLAEAFYLALPQLSWQSVIVGDPLCRPFAGRVLTEAELLSPVDTVTELPALFGARRMEVVRSTSAGASPEVVALIVRAETRIAKGDRQSARATLEEVIQLAPDLVEPRVQLALLYEETADIEAAMRQYRRVLELQPANAIALNNLAYRLAVDQKNPTEALPLARRAVALSPRNPDLLDTLGWIHHLLGNHGEAAKVLAEAARRAPGRAEIRLHAAIALAAIGSYTAAATHLDEAVRLAPEFDSRDDVKELRAVLQKKR
jgi:uncharacterized protein (TIGR03790 family)